MLLLTKFRAATLAVAATLLCGTAQAQWAERYDDPSHGDGIAAACCVDKLSPSVGSEE